MGDQLPAGMLQHMCGCRPCPRSRGEISASSSSQDRVGWPYLSLGPATFEIVTEASRAVKGTDPWRALEQRGHQQTAQLGAPLC
jgi:hypothetical protein